MVGSISFGLVSISLLLAAIYLCLDKVGKELKRIADALEQREQE